MECQWIRTAEHDIARLRKASRGVAVLPLSSIESHGPHLPTGSDPLCLEEILRRVAARETVAILPQLMYSFVAEATRLPGAIHIDSLLLIRLAENICDEVARNGFGKIVLLHGHGGNTALHGMFCKHILECAKPYAVYSVPPLPGMGDYVNSLKRSKHIGHACEMETSMNLVCAPELVHIEKLRGRVYAPRDVPDLGPVDTPVEWTARWPEMAVGDPSKATREEGEKIVSRWAANVVEILRRVKRDKIVPRVMAEFAAARRNPGGRRRACRSLLPP